MSIVALRKATLFGLVREKRALLSRVQALGCLHLANLRPVATMPAGETPDYAEDAWAALKYLKSAPRQRRPLRDDPEFRVEDFVPKVLDLQRAVRDTGDRRDFVANRIKALEPWGDFRLPGEGLKGQLLWFYIVPLRQLAFVARSSQVWATVHRDNRFAYVVVIAPSEPPAAAMPVPRTHTGSRSLSDLRLELEALDMELEELAARREVFTRWTALLARNLHRAEDAADLSRAQNVTLDDDALLALQGWVPEDRVDDLETFASKHGLALTLDKPTADDRPPTLLRNRETFSAGEDLVGFYQIPGYGTWDPSAVFFLSFTVFFAMILADVGYGVLLGFLLLANWKRLGRSATGRRSRTLGASLAGGTILYGATVGSYFGMGPPEGTALALVQVLDLSDYETMMRLSVYVGFGHIVLAHALMSWSGHSLAERLRPLGWIAAMAGGLLLWMGQHQPGVVTLVVGLALVIWFSRPRPIRSVADVVLRTLQGIGALAGTTQIFGDVLSYMRLFALGLASASLAITFNDLASDLASAVEGVGLLFAILIILLGHAINFALAVMGGVVHGLRLNFMEFLRWSVTEEGYPFRAFAKRETAP